MPPTSTPSHLRNIFLIVFISTLSHFSLSEPNNDNMSKISQFIVQTIDKYDYTQKGVIPVKQYKNFLAEIFIGGLEISEYHDQTLNKQAQQSLKSSIPSQSSTIQSQKSSIQSTILSTSSQQQKIPSQQLISLLHQACDQFSQKYRQKQFVDLQQFYMDLIKNFMEFLDHQNNKNKYQTIIDHFFGFVQGNNENNSENSEDRKIQQSNQENNNNQRNQIGFEDEEDQNQDKVQL